MFSEEPVTHEIPLNVKLAYRNKVDLDDVWYVFAAADLNREFSCLKVVNQFISIELNVVKKIYLTKNRASTRLTVTWFSYSSLEVFITIST